MILLVRHGQTVFNREGRFQGWRDSALTELGVAQARAMGELLRREVAGQVTVWSSPLGRALRTAGMLGVGEVRVEERLREVGLGAWEGLTHAEIAVRSPGALAGAGAADWLFRAPGGESYAAVTGRVAEWLAEVAKLPGCHVAVSHGLLGRVLRGVYCGLGREEALGLAIPQDALFRLEGGGSVRVGVDEA